MKASDIFNAFRRKNHNPELHNIHHPEFKDLVEQAFIVEGVKYYRFGKETNIPWGRYMILQTFLYEQNLRIDLPLLQEYLKHLKKSLSISKGVIDLTQAFKIVSQLESRAELAFEKDTTYRLASVMYFDENEDLYTYDKTYNDKKIAVWKGAGVTDFFYTRPMSELLGLSDSSPADLVNYINQQTQVLEDLTYETPAQ